MIDDKHFVFDEIIEPAVTQEAIYVELIQPMVKKLLNGFICTVLAYGQTGTGKTYTMGLEASDVGIVKLSSSHTHTLMSDCACANLRFTVKVLSSSMCSRSQF